MNTWRYLSDPALAQFYWPGMVTGLAIAVLCASLSVLVVLKRLAFVGQGISHAAFGGVGLAAVLARLASDGLSMPVQFAIIFAFCLISALVISWLSARSGVRGEGLEPDTAIGIILVSSMALGAVLIQRAKSTQQWESFLFGSINGVDWPDARIAWAMTALVLLTLFFTRRSLLFWAFDEPASAAWGVSGRWMGVLLMTLLALATVTAMKLAGVVLATAMLVLPGTIALKLGRRLGFVVFLALLAAVLGVLGGLIASFEFDLLTGPSVVLVLTALFAAASALAWARRRHAA